MQGKRALFTMCVAAVVTLTGCHTEGRHGGKLSMGNSYAAIPFKTEAGNMLIITAAVSGRPYRFVIDSASFTTVLDHKAAKAAKFTPSISRGKGYAYGLGTPHHILNSAVLPELRIGRLIARNVDVALTDLGTVNAGFRAHGNANVTGILGSDFLKKHGAIIDYPGAKLWLRLD